MLQIIESRISLQRLDDFFALPELDAHAIQRAPAIAHSRVSFGMGEAAPVQSAGTEDEVLPMQSDSAICIVDASFAWQEKPSVTPASATAVPMEPSSVLPLKNISWTVPSGTLACIVGGVGSGKSSFLQAILGELTKIRGTVSVRGTVAYAPQVPFVLNASLRDNVLFGRPFDEARYEAVLSACQLRPDIALFAGGDLAEIGEKGVGLSGGQKARVGLARAVYGDADVVLLDDVFAAVDSHVGAAIFTHCVCGLLRGRTVVLATHGLHFVQSPLVGSVTLLDVGQIVETSRDGPAFRRFMEQFVLNEASTVMPTPEAGEAMANATAGALATVLPSTDTLTVSASSDLPGPPACASAETLLGSKPAGSGAAETPATMITAETREVGHVRAAVYVAYVRAFGGIWTVAGVVILFALFEVLSSLSSVFLTLWENAAIAGLSPEGNMRSLAQYAAMILGSIAVLCLGHCALAIGSVRAARVLHAGMVTAVLRSPLSFFDTTPHGRVVNRFTQDTQTVDESLVSTFSQLRA